MSAIITDQFRILNAKNFIASVASTNNSYYTFVGLPNSNDISSTWDISPPDPKDNFDEENNYWDTLIALKKINSTDIKQVIRKITWQSGVTYDMYRHDIKSTNRSKPSDATSLYDANYYVINSDYRVYICLQNGTTPENPSGRASLDEPTFTDLEPKEAGSSGDGYTWKYLYTIKPSDIIKFDSTNFMPVPIDWETNSDYSPVRNNSSAPNNQLKIITIVDRGVGLGTANKIYTRVPIKGDGSGAEATVVINSSSKVESVTISSGGDGYTFGTLDLASGNVPTGSTKPIFNIIIPPSGGHGSDIYRELGARNALIYSRIENDTENPDFIVGNQIARIGIIENPLKYNSSSLLVDDKASGVYALKLTGVGYSSASFTADSLITQTIGLGSTAVGRVISYDKVTGVLKYWQDRTTSGFNTDATQNSSPSYGFNLNRFVANPDFAGGGSISIVGTETNLAIQTSFTGISTVINSKTYYLGQSFAQGISQPEVKKYSGNIIYVDNRPSITRSTSQKEDIKIILQF